MDGRFGPIPLKRNVPYEIRGFDSNGTLAGYLYYTPFKRSNYLLSLLTPSSCAAVKQASTDHVVRSPNHTGIVARWGGGGFRQDLGASLTVDGTEHMGPFQVLTDQNAGQTALMTSLGGMMPLQGGVVGFFMYDNNQNMMSDLGLPYAYSFIAFTDVYMQATTPGFINFSLTPGSEDPNAMNISLKASNWPSADSVDGGTPVGGGLVEVFFQ
jgi:hypothetical protein